jgi:hypothetical protein
MCVSVVVHILKYIDANSQKQTVVNFLYGNLCSEEIQVEHLETNSVVFAEYTLNSLL